MNRQVSRNRMGRFCKTIQILLIAALAVTLTLGCTTLHPVTLDPGVITDTIRHGDKIHVVLKDGKVLDFEVKEITDTQIIGEKESATFSDIAQIDRREFSPGENVGLVAAVAGGVFLLLAVSFFVSIGRSGL